MVNWLRKMNDRYQQVFNKYRGRFNVTRILCFWQKKICYPSGRNVKKALKLLDTKKIVNYPPTSEAEERSKDLWLLVTYGMEAM